MRLIELFTIGVLSMVVSACGGGTEPNTGNSQEIPTITEAFEQEYLVELNKVRTINQYCGSDFLAAASAFIWSEKLYKSSYEHSYDLATSNTFSHSGSGQESDWTGTVLGHESSLSERIDAYNYSWSGIAENIGAGTNIDTAAEIVAQLMSSEGHCKNIMNSDYTEVGMAMVKNSDSDYVHYWTQNFGRP